MRLTSLDRPLYPNGFTKGDVVDYYRGIAPVLLYQLIGHPMHTDRPVTKPVSVPASSQPVHRPVEVILGGQSQNQGASR